MTTQDILARLHTELTQCANAADPHVARSRQSPAQTAMSYQAEAFFRAADMVERELEQFKRSEVQTNERYDAYEVRRNGTSTATKVEAGTHAQAAMQFAADDFTGLSFGGNYCETLWVRQISPESAAETEPGRAYTIKLYRSPRAEADWSSRG